MTETEREVEKKKEVDKEIIDDEGLLKKIEPEGVMGWIVTGIAVAFSSFTFTLPILESSLPSGSGRFI